MITIVVSPDGRQACSATSVAQGTTVCQMSVAAPFADSAAVTATFTLPNGTILPARVLSKIAFNPADGGETAAWTLTLDKDVTGIPGTVAYSVTFTDTAGGNLCTVRGSFTVAQGASAGVLPASPSEATWASVLAALAAVNNNLSLLQAIVPQGVTSVNIATTSATQAAGSATQAAESAAAAEAALELVSDSSAAAASAAASKDAAADSATAAEKSAATASQAYGNLLKMLGEDIATLVDGKIPASQIPAIATTEIYTAGSQSEMNALTVQRGDICIRTDENKSYIYNDNGWVYLVAPTDYAAESGHALTADNATNAATINGHRMVQMTATDFENAVKDSGTYYLVWGD